MTFLKLTLAVCLLISAAATVRADQIALQVDQPLPIAATRALSELREALTAHGDEPLSAGAAVVGRASIIVGLSGKSVAVQTALKSAAQAAPTAAESAAIFRVPRSLMAPAV